MSKRPEARHGTPGAPAPFKRPPKRFQPKGITVMYEDRDLLVVDKANGLLTVSTDKVREQTAYYLLTDYVRKGNSKSRNRIFVVHRLDRETSGVLVFAKTPRAKMFLQEQWSDFRKTYYAVVHGALDAPEGVLSAYLAENEAHRVYVVEDPRKGKLAKTGYRVIKQTKLYSLLEIDLLTGRKNQIRAQLADLGHPVAGDRKYGERDKYTRTLALHAASLTLRHPHTKQEMTFEAPLPRHFEVLVGQAAGPSPHQRGA